MIFQRKYSIISQKSDNRDRSAPPAQQIKVFFTARAAERYIIEIHCYTNARLFCQRNSNCSFSIKWNFVKKKKKKFAEFQEIGGEKSQITTKQLMDDQRKSMNWVKNQQISTNSQKNRMYDLSSLFLKQPSFSLLLSFSIQFLLIFLFLHIQ